MRQSNVTRLMAPVWSSASNESVRLLLEDERPVIRRKAFEVVKGELAENDMDLTRFGGHPRVWRQSLLEGGPHAEENKVSLHRGV